MYIIFVSCKICNFIYWNSDSICHNWRWILFLTFKKIQKFSISFPKIFSISFFDFFSKNVLDLQNFKHFRLFRIPRTQKFLNPHEEWLFFTGIHLIFWISKISIFKTFLLVRDLNQFIFTIQLYGNLHSNMYVLSFISFLHRISYTFYWSLMPLSDLMTPFTHYSLFYQTTNANKNFYFICSWEGD